MIRSIRFLPLLACGALILESGSSWAQTATRRRAAKPEDSFPRLGVEPPPSSTFPPVRPEDAEPASSPAVVTPAATDAAPSAIPAAVDPLHGGAIMEPTEFVDQDIRDVLRAVARAYNLNIFPHPEVKGRVTVTLHRIPVIDALRNIAQLLGYELSWDGNAYYVAPPRVKSSGSIRVAEKTITISVESQDVRKFAEDFARRTGLNLLVDRNAKGTVTGMLRDVDPVDGLRALLSANGFAMRPQGDILVIESDGAGDDPSRMGGGGFAGGMMGRGRLDLQVRRGLVTATLRNAQLSDVVRQLADQSGLNMITYGQIGGVVDANLRDVPIDRAMTMILQGTPFTYVLKDSVIMIGDRNPGSASGQALSSTEIVYLKHARVDKLLSLLPKNLPAQGLQPVPELNALMLSGTSEQNQKVREFLDLIDREVPQVVIEAVVVEFNRGKNLEYGLKQAPYAKNDSALTGPILGFNTRIAGRVPDTLSLGGFELGAIGLLPQSFQLQLSAMENSSLGKVLARPRITTLNGQPANINVGQTDYFQVVTPGRDINSIPTIDYRAFNSGINLSITPYVTESGFVTAELKPEVRTPTSAGGSGANAPPATSTRSISTNVRLKDGETLVLGGLIQTLDLSGSTGVPLLSAIPLIGKLFTYRTKQKTTTELVIFITPRIIRGGGGMVDINDEIERLQRKYEPYSLNRIFGDRDFEVAAAPESSRKGKLVEVARPDAASDSGSPARSDTAARALPASLNSAPASPEASVPSDAPAGPSPVRVPQPIQPGAAEVSVPAPRTYPTASPAAASAPANADPSGAPRPGAPRGRVVRPTPIGPSPARSPQTAGGESSQTPAPLSPSAGAPADGAPSP